MGKIKNMIIEQMELGLTPSMPKTFDAVSYQKTKRKQEIANARTLDELYVLQRKYGYQRGWVGHIWKARKIKEGTLWH